MITALLPVAIGVIGILVWALASNAILKEAGKIAFAASLLTTTVHLLAK